MTPEPDLDALVLFRQLSEVSKAMLGPGLHCVRYDAKTQVLGKGQPVSGAYVVVAGRLRVYTLSPEGREATLYWVARGETCVLALNCLFNDLLYPAWVEAEAATQVAVIPGSLYRILFNNEAVIRDLTIESLATGVFRLMAELEQVHSRTLEQRLANFLLLHASADGVLRMTQQQIAAHLGTSREVVARLLGQWATRKFIATARGAVTIRQPARLARL